MKNEPTTDGEFSILKDTWDQGSRSSRSIVELPRCCTNRLRICADSFIFVMATVPLFVSFGTEPKSKTDTKAANVEGAVATLRGYVTNEAGLALSNAVVRISIPARDMRFVYPSSAAEFQSPGAKFTQLEATTNEQGQYRLKIPGIAKSTNVSIDAMKPGYRRLVGTLMAGGDAKEIEVVPGAIREATLVLKPALYFAGLVVDENGKPIPAVEIGANANDNAASAGVERTESKLDGTFELFNYSPERFELGNGISKGVVHFSHKNYLGAEIDDAYSIAEDQRETMKIVLRTGNKVSGTVLDAMGKPAANVMIKATLADGGFRKAIMTDANGQFLLQGLSAGDSVLSVTSFDLQQKIRLPIVIDSDKSDFEVRLQPISLPKNIKTYSFLGMQLTDLTPDLKKAFAVRQDVGALILDPGTDSERLEIGRLAKGYLFWMAGNNEIGSFREFVKQILAEAENQKPDEYSVRVVYSLSTLEFDGTNTQYLKLTNEDVAQLKSLHDKLNAE